MINWLFAKGVLHEHKTQYFSLAQSHFDLMSVFWTHANVCVCVCLFSIAHFPCLSHLKLVNPSAQVSPCDAPQFQLLDLDYANRASRPKASEEMWLATCWAISEDLNSEIYWERERYTHLTYSEQKEIESDGWIEREWNDWQRAEALCAIHSGVLTLTLRQQRQRWKKCAPFISCFCAVPYRRPATVCFLAFLHIVGK